jgi:hypothetical protein
MNRSATLTVGGYQVADLGPTIIVRLILDPDSGSRIAQVKDAYRTANRDIG